MSCEYLKRLIIALVLAVACMGSAHAQLVESVATEQATGASEDQSVETLLKILRDDVARQSLIDRLEKPQSDKPQNDAGQTELPGAETEPPSLARVIADFTKEGAEQIYDGVAKLWLDFSGIESLFEALPDARKQRIRENGPALAGTIAMTIMTLWVLSALMVRALRHWLPPREKRSSLATIASASVGLISDAIAVALSYASGYVLALFLLGSGKLSLEQSLYLNAFLVAGAFRILVRTFVRPNQPELAVFNFAPIVQRTIHDRLVFLFQLLAYGIVAVVPIANFWTSFVLGRALRVVVVTAGAVLALLAIRHVRALMKQSRDDDEHSRQLDVSPATDTAVLPAGNAGAVSSAMGSVWRDVWPIPAILYVLSCYVIAIVNPTLMTDLIASATFKTVIVAGIIAVAFRFIRHSSSVGVPFPASLQRTLPDLKRRFDLFAPYVLRACGVLLLGGGAIFFLHAWHLIDAAAWVAQPETVDFLWRVLSAVLIAFAVIATWAVISSWIDHRLNLDLSGRNVSARARTLLALFKNAFTIMVFVFGAMMALSQLGVDIAPLLAGAGVIGLAIGFGSQKLVQDIITGVFIQLENAINEGDVITVCGTTGTVEKLTIRSVALRDIDGAYHIIPFSAVDMVSNYMRKYAYHVAVFGVSYDVDLELVKAAMEDAFEELKQTAHKTAIIGPLEMHGVIGLGESSVDVRARIKTRPGTQWSLGRAYTEIVKKIFDERGIEIPYPHRTLVYVPGQQPAANREPDPVIENSAQGNLS